MDDTDLRPAASAAPPSAAASTDGRRFVASVPRGTVQLTDLVVLEPPGAPPLLGQVVEVGDPHAGGAFPAGSGPGASQRLAVQGRVLGTFEHGRPPGRARVAPFDGAGVRPLTREEVSAFQDATGADLTVGTWPMSGLEAPLRLRSAGFNRHTFLCGQSGSGKTYALGVVLEQLVLHTALPLVVLDPNADFVHLARPRPDAPGDLSARVREADVEVLHGGGTGEDALHVTFTELPPHAQAAVLELEPLRDRAEYHEWLQLQLSAAPKESTSAASVRQLTDRLLASDESGARALGQRIDNLGVTTWDVWPYGDAPDRSHRVTVLDLMGFRTKAEPLVAALDVVERLWAERESRRPTLVVIDEAHNLVPAEPRTPLQQAVTERVVQIAAEGRKYGIWLLVSTQRPSKVHPQIVSQCDNLVLMRMNSSADIAELGRFFGFVPTPALELSPYFAQGELLVAGAFAPVPTLGRVGARLTVEGGSDVAVPMP